MDTNIKLNFVPDTTKVNAAVGKLKGSLQGIQGLMVGAAAAWITTQGIQRIMAATSATIDYQNALKGLVIQSNAAGISSKALLSSLQDVTEGQVSLERLTLSSNKAIALLGNSAIPRFEELAEVAAKASSVMGISVTQAFDDIVTGIGRQSRMILDNLGIIISVTEANENYAAQLGKTVAQLTDAEKKQGFLNATLDQAKEKYGDLAVQVNPVQQLTAGLDNLGKAFIGIFSREATTGIGDLASGIERLATFTEEHGPEIKNALVGIATAVAGLTALKLPVWIAATGPTLGPVVKLIKDLGPAMGWFLGSTAELTTDQVGLTMALEEQGLIYRGLLTQITKLGLVVYLVTVVFKNWESVLTTVGSVIRVTTDAILLLIEGVLGLINLIPGLNITLETLSRILSGVEKAISLVFLGFELFFRGLDVGIGFLRSLMGETIAYTDALGRLDAFLDGAYDKLGLYITGVETATSETDGTTIAVDALAEALDTLGPTSGIQGLIDQFNDLTVATQQSLLAGLVAQGLITRGDVLDPGTIGPTRPDRPSAAGEALAGEFGLEAILRAITGVGRGTDTARLREALGFGGDTGGGGAGIEFGKPGERASRRARQGREEDLRVQEQLIAAHLEKLRLIRDAVEVLKAENRARIAVIMQLEADKLSDVGIFDYLDRKPKLTEAERAKRIALGLHPENLPEELESTFDKFIKDLSKTLTDAIAAWGWQGQKPDAAGIGQQLLRGPTSAWGGNVLSYFGASEAGAAAWGGPVGAIISAGIGWGFNEIFNQAKPIEIKQPLNVHIDDDQFRLLNFYNQRGLEARAYGTSFRAAFLGGLN